MAQKCDIVKLVSHRLTYRQALTNAKLRIMAKQKRRRGERVQLMLDPDELELIDKWQHEKRMPSRAAAMRELLRRGLDNEGLNDPDYRRKSKDFGVGGS
jgi:hypothetical protein